MLQRAIANHHAGSVRGSMAVKPLKFQADIEKLFDLLIIAVFFLQPGFSINGLLQGYRIGRVEIIS